MERETFCTECSSSCHYDSDLGAWHCWICGYLADWQVEIIDPQFDLTDAGYKLLVQEQAHPALKLTAKALAALGELPNHHVDQQAS